jgi:hypothetical protein
LHRLL